MRVLILGGTSEARALADRLVSLGHEVVTSLAGRTRDPILPQGEVRTGGFGGVSGLCIYLQHARIDWVVDATHPFAEQMSRNADAASAATGIPLVRYVRPQWQPTPGQVWINAQSAQGAADALPASARVLLTTGHAGLEAYRKRQDCQFFIRLIEAPDLLLPGNAVLLQGRPPYDLAHEMALMRDHRITHLVSKNSGGDQIAAKLEAAAALGVAVIMIARPIYGPALEVGSIDGVLAAIGAARD